MTTTQQLMVIGLMAAAVAATRFLPFVLFPSEERTPGFVRFLGRYLASAVFGMLVVYCVKDVPFMDDPHGLPQLLGIAATVALHCWRRNLLLSIAGGTVAYMVLVQTIF